MKIFGPLLISLVLFSSCLNKKTKEAPDHILVIQSLENYGKSVKSQKKTTHFVTYEDVKETKVLYCMTFTNNYKVNLEDSRILATNLVEEFWQMLKNNSNIKEAIKKRGLEEPKYPKEVGLEHLSWTMKFQDKKGSCSLPPAVAEIRFEDETFYYYESLPATDRLNLVFEESYDAAIAFRDNCASRKSSNLEGNYSIYPKPNGFRY